MSISNKYDQLIQERKAIKGDIDYDNESVIKRMINLLTKNIDETIDFIKNDCSEEQFIWMSEIFDEIVEQTQNEKLISALQQTAKKYPKATREYNIDYFIKSAAEYLK